MNSEEQETNSISKLFKKFRKIPEQGHYEYLTFCKYYSKEINELNFEEYIEIKYVYIKALFRLDKIFLFNKISEQTLNELLNHYEFNDHHKDIYQKILVLKAKQCIEENKLMSAQEIYKNLLKLKPTDKGIKKKYMQLRLVQEQYQSRKFLGLAVIILMLILIISIAQQLFINPFLPHLSGLTDKILQILFCFPVLIIGFVYLRAAYKIRREVQKNSESSNLSG